MENLKAKIITSIIGAVLGGSITGGITYMYDDSDDIIKRNEFLIGKNAKLESVLLGKESKISMLETNIMTSENNYRLLNESFQKLSEDYQILDDKYKKCISSNGLTENIGSIDLNKYSKQFRTGDNLKFDLASQPMKIKFVRVSDRGPIMEICDCLNYLTVNSMAISSVNKNQFLLQLGKPFKIRFTMNSCENDLAIEPSKLEEIQICLLNFNIEDQIFQIEYNRDFLIK
jgi:hypothetical protein